MSDAIICPNCGKSHTDDLWCPHCSYGIYGNYIWKDGLTHLFPEKTLKEEKNE